MRPARWAAYAGTRFLELALIVFGIRFTFVASDPSAKLSYLATWDLVAFIYLSIGVVVLRRLRGERNLPVELAEHAPAWSRVLRGPGRPAAPAAPPAGAPRPLVRAGRPR